GVRAADGVVAHEALLDVDPARAREQIDDVEEDAALADAGDGAVEHARVEDGDAVDAVDVEHRAGTAAGAVAEDLVRLERRAVDLHRRAGGEDRAARGAGVASAAREVVDPRELAQHEALARIDGE